MESIERQESIWVNGAALAIVVDFVVQDLENSVKTFRVFTTFEFCKTFRLQQPTEPIPSSSDSATPSYAANTFRVCTPSSLYLPILQHFFLSATPSQSIPSESAILLRFIVGRLKPAM